MFFIFKESRANKCRRNNRIRKLTLSVSTLVNTDQPSFCGNCCDPRAHRLGKPITTQEPQIHTSRWEEASRGASTGEKQSDQGSVVNTDESSGPKAGTEGQLVQVPGQVVRSTEHTHSRGWAATKGSNVSKEKPKPRRMWHIHWIQCVYPSGFLVFVCYEGLISQGPCW